MEAGYKAAQRSKVKKKCSDMTVFLDCPLPARLRAVVGRHGYAKGLKLYKSINEEQNRSCYIVYLHYNVCILSVSIGQ